MALLVGQQIAADVFHSFSLERLVKVGCCPEKKGQRLDILIDLKRFM